MSEHESIERYGRWRAAHRDDPDYDEHKGPGWSGSKETGWTWSALKAGNDLSSDGVFSKDVGGVDGPTPEEQAARSEQKEAAAKASTRQLPNSNEPPSPADASGYSVVAVGEDANRETYLPHFGTDGVLDYIIKPDGTRVPQEGLKDFLASNKEVDKAIGADIDAYNAMTPEQQAESKANGDKAAVDTEHNRAAPKDTPEDDVRVHERFVRDDGSSTPKKYSFEDPAQADDKNYRYTATVDDNGKTTYSRIEVDGYGKTAIGAKPEDLKEGSPAYDRAKELDDGGAYEAARDRASQPGFRNDPEPPSYGGNGCNRRTYKEGAPEAGEPANANSSPEQKPPEGRRPYAACTP